ncbi:ABC transporter, PDR-type [Pseudocercospora fijiensis CIRAD86]|uniref:ABC transporter, PDR-type n=1 Tax=Pseudocercospora fijiensis (strain CIRAD86) TaxID=383855 RepID=M3AT94_PSEFD|nr:ABC transporter, PDR-type [Pseudocercospora fijiensis CIRAD86]EME80697.1 ABC transporter, PDR-type [Pseudocercospora fijiensis CIRAD86]
MEQTKSIASEQLSASSTGKDESSSSLQVGATPTEEWESRQERSVDVFLNALPQGQHSANVSASGVVFRDLYVARSVQQCTAPHTFASAALGDILSRILKCLRASGTKATCTPHPVIRNFTGVVGNGEMMLVLGRAGSGCSTFLKAISHRQDQDTSATGHVSCAGRSSYCPEDDQHFPALTVRQTLEFALRSSFPTETTRQIGSLANALLEIFGMELSSDTLIGNTLKRGISGGERKRVSVMEALSLQSPISAWDNITCGLDANAALRLIRCLRLITHKTNRSAVIALNQAGDEIYHLFDKVLVIHGGRMLYQGPTGDARQYFQSLGYRIKTNQPMAEFLTNLISSGNSVHNCGRTAEDLEQIFRDSKANELVLAEVKRQEVKLEALHGSAGDDSSQTHIHHRSFVPNYRQQVINCVRREFWLKSGDWRRQVLKYLLAIADALVVASLYYDIPESTAGLLSRSGATLFAALLLIWVQLCEVDETLSSRAFLERHRQYGLYRPSAAMLARFVVDWIMIPTLVVPLVIIIYFMANFALNAGKFFAFLAFVWILTLCVTALFRLLAISSASPDNAVRFAGVAHNVLLMFAGYTITKSRLMADRPWIGWIAYINPLAYGFEGMLSSQLHDDRIPCAPEHLVPYENGSGISPQTCSIPGTGRGNTDVRGHEYLSKVFQYNFAHLWRNFALIVVLTGVYLFGTWVASEKMWRIHQPARQRVVVQTGQDRRRIADEDTGDVEKNLNDHSGASDSGTTETMNESPPSLGAAHDLFAWKSINYTVKDGVSSRQVLVDINGYVARGVLMALVGPSGSGKTSLLHALSGQQAANSVVTGIATMSGKTAARDFRRSIGLVAQVSILEETATVREALEFSAILRQDPSFSKIEKLQYVAHLLSVLGLQGIANTIIGSLSYAERKLVDIGYELVARPSLVMMDEPISGLDAQAALSIIRLLRRLCDSGMKIICSIHQPSTEILRHFDTLFALDLSGRCVYSGSALDLRQYLATRGVLCTDDAHGIALIIDSSMRSSTGEGWAEEWSNSDEIRALSATIQVIQHDKPSSISEKRRSFAPHAAPLALQVRLLTTRLLLQYWREPSYWYTWISVSLTSGLINGLCFWQVGNTLASLQDRMFSVFLIILLPPIIVNTVKVRFYQNLLLWTTRELPSGTYDFTALCAACILAEIPMATVSALLYFLSWYLPSGISHQFSTGCYVFAMTLFYFWFLFSWAQWICMLLPDIEMVSNALPFFFAVTGLCNGVVRPFSQLPSVWSRWLYWVNPMTWWIGGILSTILGNLHIECTESELIHFDPPANTTCGQYISNADPGYVLAPDATSNCMYCPFATGTGYFTSLGFHRQRKWLSLGLFASFVVTNWLLFFFLTGMRHSKRLHHKRETTIRRMKEIANALVSLNRKSA